MATSETLWVSDILLQGLDSSPQHDRTGAAAHSPFFLDSLSPSSQQQPQPRQRGHRVAVPQCGSGCCVRLGMHRSTRTCRQKCPANQPVPRWTAVLLMITPCPSLLATPAVGCLEDQPPVVLHPSRRWQMLGWRQRCVLSYKTPAENESAR